MDEQDVRIRLLLVDDEDEFLAATSRVLARRGIEVLVARGGEEALDRLQQEEVDVVVLDMKMPGMDGATTFDGIRRIWPDLPVIILTGHDSIPEAFEMTRKGLFDYLLKPCSIEALTLTIHEAVVEMPAGGAGEEQEEIVAPHSSEQVRVLLVDDEVELLHTLKKVLTRRAMDVHVAKDGKEALALLEDTPIDVVVLDVKMAGMDGLEVLKRIKAGPVNREVILLTGHPSVENAMSGMKLGALEYQIKPPDMARLTQSICKANHLRKEKLAREQQETIQDILRRHPD